MYPYKPATTLALGTPSISKSFKKAKLISNKRRNFHIKNNPNKKLLNATDFAKIIIDVLSRHWRHANDSIININVGIYQEIKTNLKIFIYYNIY